jgi:hypothetical protein
MSLSLILKTAKTTPTTTTPTTTEAVDAAVTYRDLVAELDALRARLEVARADLMTHAEGMRTAALEAGDASNIKINTGDGGKVQIIYTERYSGLDVANLPLLKDAFGSSVDRYVDTSEEVKLRKGVSLADIEAAAGKAAAKRLSALLEVKRQVKPRKGAFAEAAALFRSGEVERARDLLTFAQACATRPTVRAK